MSASKAAKAILFSAQAHEHHTLIKVRNVLRWLKAGHEVRIQITGKSDRQRAIEQIMGHLEKDIKGGAKYLQKVIKPGSLKVILKPTEEAVNIKISDIKLDVNIDKELEDMTNNRDILSEDFEKDLIKSIREERAKYKNKP